MCACTHIVAAREREREESEEEEEKEEEEWRHDAAVSGYESHERLSHCKHACNRDSSRADLAPARTLPTSVSATQVPGLGSSHRDRTDLAADARR